MKNKKIKCFTYHSKFLNKVTSKVPGSKYFCDSLKCYLTIY